MSAAAIGTIYSLAVIILILAVTIATHRLALLRERRKDGLLWGKRLKWIGYAFLLIGVGIAVASWWKPFPREVVDAGIGVSILGIIELVWGDTLLSRNRNEFAQSLRVPLLVSMILGIGLLVTYLMKAL